ncbi:hypothetical protein DRO51_00305 [Candidatus Bathyarchaeota archaeon]|nr:MAG: hypothetical protein DRO51_00305 [Candidatus Bathyarchaeota archaeon]
MKQKVLEVFKVEILRALDEVVKSYPAEALLLSGGLDTSIIACLASRHFKPKTLTVCFSGVEAPDLKYAKLVAEQFNLENYVKLFSFKEASEAARQVVRIIGSFDPMEIRNDITIYVGMQWLKEHGFHSVLTGDGADELFAGYSFLFKLTPHEVDEWIRRVSERWFFAAKPIGESFGLKVYQPFTDKRVVELALNIPAEYKIVNLHGVTYGKYVLRFAFEKLLPAEVVWREKHPVEVGSGSIMLSQMFKVSAEEYNQLSKLVKISSQEEAYYLKLYLEEFGSIPKPKVGEKTCPKCGAGVSADRNYCKICGAYPV